jgi:hypothetical protein
MKEIARSLCPPVLWKLASRARSRHSAVNSLDGDELMKWMSFINPGMLNAGNLELFAHCIEHLPSDAPLIEIGSFAGKSLNCIIHLLRKARRTNPVFSVDEWNFEGSRLGGMISDEVSFEAYRAHVINTFHANVSLFSGGRLPHHIELTSDAFFAAWDTSDKRTDYFGKQVQLGGPIALAYVDGDHTYSQSKKDFENIDRSLQAGGFIIFDDSGDGSHWGSNQTAREAAVLPSYELIAKNPNYCIRKRGIYGIKTS